MALLTIENVYAGYDRADVLHDVNLTVRAGETVALYPPSSLGSGG